jgi:hypothetical protein
MAVDPADGLASSESSFYSYVIHSTTDKVGQKMEGYTFLDLTYLTIHQSR